MSRKPRDQKPTKAHQPDESDYAVGYGRPPKQHQFKPGVSGDPKGRPKKHKSFSEMTYDLLLEKLLLRVDGEKSGCSPSKRRSANRCSRRLRATKRPLSCS